MVILSRETRNTGFQLVLTATLSIGIIFTIIAKIPGSLKHMMKDLTILGTVTTGVITVELGCT
jgi:hypothetical protein